MQSQAHCYLHSQICSCTHVTGQGRCERCILAGAYESLDLEMVTDYLEAIKGFPAMPKPEIFGLHENADITCDQNETYNLFSTILALQPRVSGGGGAGREDTILQLCQSISAKVRLQHRASMTKHCPGRTYGRCVMGHLPQLVSLRLAHLSVYVTHLNLIMCIMWDVRMWSAYMHGVLALTCAQRMYCGELLARSGH